MERTHRVEELIAPSLEALGFELIRVRYSGAGHPTLQIMIERLDRAPLTIDECATASNSISALLDVEDPINEAYNLEVSSPGLDRPLTRIGDFERFAGFEAKIELAALINGRKRYRGQLLGVEGGNVRISADGIVAMLPFTVIKNAKLILTDELISAAESQKRM